MGAEAWGIAENAICERFPVKRTRITPTVNPGLGLGGRGELSV